MVEENNVIEMLGVTKAFGNFKANDDINLQVKKGEIHALLGENGAGKSTLMNILSGLLQPTSGIIKINGQEVEISSPTVADKLGIGMVHQHFMLVKDFTVTENIILGSETSSYGILDKRKAQKNQNRIPEKSLLMMTLFGGTIGSILGMMLFNHKISKRNFVLKILGIILLQILILYLIDNYYK